MLCFTLCFIRLLVCFLEITICWLWTIIYKRWEQGVLQLSHLPPKTFWRPEAVFHSVVPKGRQREGLWESCKSGNISQSLGLSLPWVILTVCTFPLALPVCTYGIKNKTFSQPNQQSFVDTHQVCAYFPNKWGEISLTVYLPVSVTITHWFPSGWHGRASSPGAARRKTPTCPRWSQPVLGNARQLILLTLYCTTGEWVIHRETAEVCVAEKGKSSWRDHHSPPFDIRAHHQTTPQIHMHGNTQTPRQTQSAKCLLSAAATREVTKGSCKWNKNPRSVILTTGKWLPGNGFADTHIR